MKKILLSVLLCSSCLSANAFALDAFHIYDDKPEQICNDVSVNGKVDLSVVMEKAICANPALKISYLSSLISGANYGQGLSNYLPDLSVTGSLSAASSKKDGADNSDDNADLGFSAKLNWLLLDFGGRSANASRLKMALHSSYFAYDEQIQTLLYNVAQKYYAVLSAEEKYEGLMEAEKSFKKAFEEASSRYELGLVPLSDKLQAQTSYEQAKLSSNVARKNIALERGNLANLLNVPPYTLFELKRPEKNLEKLPPKKKIKECKYFCLTY